MSPTSCEQPVRRGTVRPCCSPRPSMSIAPRDAKWSMRRPALRRAVDVVQNVSLSPSSRTSGPSHDGHVVGNFHGCSPFGPQRQHRPDDLGDDVARLAHDDGVAGAHVLGLHLVLVVQRGQPDGRAADEHRLEHGERRGLPGAADRHHDVLEQRGALLGRELVGDGPARRLRRRRRARRAARGRRPSPPRRRSRRRGRGGAPASAGSTRTPRRACRACGSRG